MAELGNANIGGRMVPAWLLNLTAEELDGLKEHSNPNLLDNPWFTVNQRGQTTYSTAYAYTVDRWRMDDPNMTLDVNDDGTITLSEAVDGNRDLSQYLEDDVLTSLLNKTLTASILFQDGQLFSATFNAPSTVLTTWFGLDIPSKKMRIFIAPAYKAMRFSIRIYGIGSHVIKAVKLEVGAISTLENDTLPNYQQELVKCMTSKAGPDDTYANRSIAPKMVDSERGENHPIEYYNGSLITRKMYRGFDVWEPSPRTGRSPIGMASWGRSYRINVGAGQTVNFPLMSDHTYLISASDNARCGVCLIQAVDSAIGSITTLVPMRNWSVSIGTGLTIDVKETDGRYVLSVFIMMI